MADERGYFVAPHTKYPTIHLDRECRQLHKSTEVMRLIALPNDTPICVTCRDKENSMKIALIVLAILVAPVLAWADGPVVKQSTCVLTWEAPQTNADGTNLADLKEYGVYIGTAPNLMAAPVAVVPAPSSDPVAGVSISWSCSHLPLGQQYAQVDAVDLAGNRSTRTALLPFVLAEDVAPAAPTNLRIGP